MDLPDQLVGVLDRLAADLRDHVTALDSRFRGRAVVLNACDKRAVEIVLAEAVCNLGSDGLNLGPDRSARHGALFLELRDDRFDSVGWNREGNSRRASGRRQDHVVDADDLAIGVEARPAGIAAVDRRIDLDETFGRTGLDLAFTRRDDTRRHRAPQSERIADGKDPVANARRLVGELHVSEVRAAVDLDQGEVAELIASDEPGRIGLVVAGADLDRLPVAALDD